MILKMNFSDSIRCDSVNQVQNSSNWRTRQIKARDSKLREMIARVAKAGVGIGGRINVVHVSDYDFEDGLW